MLLLRIPGVNERPDGDFVVFFAGSGNQSRISLVDVEPLEIKCAPEVRFRARDALAASFCASSISTSAPSVERICLKSRIQPRLLFELGARSAGLPMPV